MKVYFKTLGCDKNTWDTDRACGLLKNEGHVIVDDPTQADVLIVNSCGFINDAKEQSIEATFDLAADKRDDQILIMSGCLAQRYAKDLEKSMPEVDYFIGVNNYETLPALLNAEEKGRDFTKAAEKEFTEYGSRAVTSTGWTAPIKIAEGCNNVCTYCIIPFIRGKYRSRKPEEIIAEAKDMAAAGVKELLVIAQDVTGYGKDFGRTDMLPELLHELCQIDGIHWIRLMYCYEDEITPGLIKAMVDEPKIVPYIDVPIQHASDKILKAMNRKSTKASIKATVEELRKQVPGIVIRTTLITGFPGETKEEFQELYDFVQEMKFDRLGVFAYSKEEGTAAARMKGQVRQDAKERRRDKIMALQQGISLELNQKYIGRTLEVLVEEVYEDGSYSGRSRYDAPDIDNGVLFTSIKKLQPGEFVHVYIKDAFDYDLSGDALL